LHAVKNFTEPETYAASREKTARGMMHQECIGKNEDEGSEAEGTEIEN
jgi:hypothetical protein